MFEFAGVALADEVLDARADGLDDGGGDDAVFMIVGQLDGAAACAFVERFLHGLGGAVGVEDDLTGGVARGAADGLDQRTAAAQETFLVGVEHHHEGDFGQVEALAQQVDADEHVEAAEAQIF